MIADRLLLPASLLALAFCAVAAPPDPLPSGRYLAMVPGLTLDATLSYDARDEVYGEHGERQSSVAPAYGEGNRFPETRLTLDFNWHLPLFEADAIPFVSSRLWNARARLGYAQTHTRGPIGDVATAEGGPSAKSGIGDLELAFGPVLYGSADWRTRTSTPLSVLLLAEIRLPTGARDPASPNNVGDSTYAYGGRLGANWQPQGLLSGFLVDAGLRYRVYGGEQEPAFNAQAPTQQGADLSFDTTIARRLWRGLHAQVSYTLRDGAANEYRKVREAATPPPADRLMETFPDSGAQHDRGTREQRLQFGLGGFVTQRFWLGAQYSLPLSGRSGGFDLPYQQQVAGCRVVNMCMPMANGSAHVDGLGSARTYASDLFMLNLRWSPAASRGAR